MIRPPRLHDLSPFRLASRVRAGGGSVLLFAALLLTPTLPAHGQDPAPDAGSGATAAGRAEARDAVSLRLRVGGGEPLDLQVVGELEGLPRGRPSTEIPRAGLPHPISIEVAIVDRDHGVIEVHLFRGSTTPGPSSAGADTPFAKLLLEPGVPAVARLDDGASLRVEVLAVGFEEIPADGGTEDTGP
ncbi:MAG: hypothetical protein MI919_36850 [Holophagales bacterium]|nr:hypothetical protein [Holophagales bacterium]